MVTSVPWCVLMKSSIWFNRSPWHYSIEIISMLHIKRFNHSFLLCELMTSSLWFDRSPWRRRWSWRRRTRCFDSLRPNGIVTPRTRSRSSTCHAITDTDTKCRIVSSSRRSRTFWKSANAFQVRHFVENRHGKYTARRPNAALGMFLFGLQGSYFWFLIKYLICLAFM